MKPYACFATAIRPGAYGDVATAIQFVWAADDKEAETFMLGSIEEACPKSRGYRRYSVTVAVVPVEFRKEGAKA